MATLIRPVYNFRSSTEYPSSISGFSFHSALSMPDRQIKDGDIIERAEPISNLYVKIDQNTSRVYPRNIYAHLRPVDRYPLTIPYAYEIDIDPFLTYANGNPTAPRQWFSGEMFVEQSTIQNAGCTITPTNARYETVPSIVKTGQFVYLLFRIEYDGAQGVREQTWARSDSGWSIYDGLATLVTQLELFAYAVRSDSFTGPTGDPAYKKPDILEAYLIPKEFVDGSNWSLGAGGAAGAMTFKRVLNAVPTPLYTTANVNGGWVTMGNATTNVQFPSDYYSSVIHYRAFVSLGLQMEDIHIGLDILESGQGIADMTSCYRLGMIFPANAEVEQLRKLRETVKDISSIGSSAISLGAGIFTGNPMGIIGGAGGLAQGIFDVASRDNEQPSAKTIAGAWISTILAPDGTLCNGFWIACNDYTAGTAFHFNYYGHNAPIHLDAFTDSLFNATGRLYLRGDYRPQYSTSPYYLDSYLQEKCRRLLAEGVHFVKTS